ncbi:hypothetical protein J7K93_06495, partial [bacterium]|nr:hypothetical protein [bacterium]
FDKNGFVTIIDKRTDNVFKNFGKFELSEEDENGVVKNVRYEKQEPRISIINAGPLEAGIKVRKRLKIKSKRIRGWKVVKVWVKYFLKISSNILEAEVRVEEPENKYILDMLFPTECGKVRETIEMSNLKLHKHTHSSNDLQRIGFNGFMSISDKKRSLSILTEKPVFYRLKLDNSRTVSININNYASESERKSVNYRSESRFGIFPDGDIFGKKIDGLFKIYEEFLSKK